MFGWLRTFKRNKYDQFPPMPSTDVPTTDVEAIRSMGFEFRNTANPIARGTEGHVYLGNCNELARRKSLTTQEEVSLEGLPCAIKMCVIDPMSDPEERPLWDAIVSGELDKLYTEAKKLEDLKHANVIEVFLVFKSGPHRLGELDHQLSGIRVYFVMEFANGGTLRDRLSLAEPYWTESEALQIIKGLTAGLYFLHSTGIVHNDLHQGNVMFHRDEQNNYMCKIVDLGSTKALDDYNVWSDLNLYSQHLIHILSKSEFKRNDLKTYLRLFADQINEKNVSDMNAIHDRIFDIIDGYTERPEEQTARENESLMGSETAGSQAAEPSIRRRGWNLIRSLRDGRR